MIWERVLHCLLTVVFLQLSPQSSVLSPQKPPHTLTGDIRLGTHFHSNYLKTDRDIWVYLPSGYANHPSRRYPVFYLHDGQNLFDGATSFIPGAEWQVDEAAQRQIALGKVEPVIVVAIANTPNRMEEYTPSVDQEIGQGGQADAYGRMLVEELKPWVDATYRTRPEPCHTGLGGSSLGGLVSLYLGLRYPEVFGKLAVMSPSVFWDGEFIVKQVRSLPKKTSARVWLDMGTKEGQSPQRNLARTRTLRKALQAKGWRLNRDLAYFEAVGGEHNERAWAKRVEPMLRFLFPPGTANRNCP